MLGLGKRLIEILSETKLSLLESDVLTDSEDHSVGKGSDYLYATNFYTGASLGMTINGPRGTMTFHEFSKSSPNHILTYPEFTQSACVILPDNSIFWCGGICSSNKVSF